MVCIGRTPASSEQRDGSAVDQDGALGRSSRGAEERKASSRASMTAAVVITRQPLRRIAKLSEIRENMRPR